MAKILIVSDELYPFTSGGIGRLLHNLLKHELARQVHEMHLLMPSRRNLSSQQVQTAFGDRVAYHQVVLPGAGWAARWSTHHSRARRETVTIAQRIRALQVSHGPFDVIEFPDYLGWGYATLSERLREDTRIAVRLHASRGLLAEVDKGPLDRNDQILVAQERVAVRQADVRVAHVAAVADYMAAHYEIPRESIALHFPPVVWPPPTAAAADGKETSSQHGSSSAAMMRPRETPDFLFLGKIEVTKNPELFVDACCLFFSKHKDYAGSALLACHAFDRAYAQCVEQRVERRLRERFVFRPPLTQAEWRELGGHVVVVSSLFESLSLVAFEALAAGAVVCLNQQCPAFTGPPWSDDNCVRFEPNANALCAALEHAVFGRPHLKAVVAQPQPQYWDQIPT